MIRHRTDATQGASTATEFSDTTIALMSLHLPNMQTQGSGCGLHILAPQELPPGSAQTLSVLLQFTYPELSSDTLPSL